MKIKKKTSKRILVNGLFYDKEDYENGKRIVLAAAPYGLVNKSQLEHKEVIEPIKVKGL